MKHLATSQPFSTLSLLDLLRAREQFHAHLVHKANVVGTAVGRYLIRKDDKYPTADKPESLKRGKKPPRTLENSEVRPYSWPCILVFVDHWAEDTAFGERGSLATPDYIPPAIYLEDGKTVPICVVLAPRDESVPPPVSEAELLPSDVRIEGGAPVFTEVQGLPHFATIGCLVTDGNRLYALTNRHVTGEPGHVLKSKLRAKSGAKWVTKTIEIGRSSEKQLGQMPFEKAYEGWPGRRTYVNLDVGLIDIQDAALWASSIRGAGPIGPLADLSIYNISLDLLGCPVQAHGAASRHLYGRIAALFYRFESVGGFEYVADLLIGSSNETPLRTHPGDSGSVWLVEGEDVDHDRMPIAIQWGGTVFTGDGGSLPFALATNLSTVCRELAVEIVREGVGAFEYWGAVGHYALGAFACGQPKSATVKNLFGANVEQISFKLGEVAARSNPVAMPGFVPLADVPDKVWKKPKSATVRYGRKGLENPNHYANIDYVPPGGGSSLDELTPTAASLKTATWKKYYKDLGWNSVSKRGMVPFRVWQIYKKMVDYVAHGKLVEYVGAAGILAHYVGDCCQSLHGSFLEDGDPWRKPDGSKSTKMLGHGSAFGHGLHAAYETTMIEDNFTDIVTGVTAALGSNHGMSFVTGGREAGFAAIELIRRCQKRVPPKKLLDVYVAVPQSERRKKGPAALWTKYGAKTVDNLADGCNTLAMLWESAWREGGGDQTIPASAIGPVSQTALKKLYLSDVDGPDPFLPSVALGQIDGLL